jgi:hypothetical protein
MYSAPKIIVSLDANIVLAQALGQTQSCMTITAAGHGCE